MRDGTVSDTILFFVSLLKFHPFTKKKVSSSNKVPPSLQTRSLVTTWTCLGSGVLYSTHIWSGRAPRTAPGPSRSAGAVSEPLELLGVLRLRRLVPLRVPTVPWAEVVVLEVLWRCVVLRQLRQLLSVLHDRVRVGHVEVVVESPLLPVVVGQPLQTSQPPCRGRSERKGRGLRVGTDTDPELGPAGKGTKVPWYLQKTPTSPVPE